MEPINRFALIATPKRRYMEWANAIDDDGPRLTLEELASLAEVYLLDATDSEADREELIDRYADEIWEQQLEGWSLDESTWPKNRTAHTLRDWFDLTVVDMVFDADPDVDWAEPPTDHEIAATAVETCQWCFKSIAADAPVDTLSLTLPPDDPLRAVSVVVVPILIGGQVRMAVRPQPDSEMASAGKDLLLTFCGSQCAEAMREAIRLERGALLS